MAGSVVQSRESSVSGAGGNLSLAFSSNPAAHNKFWVVGHSGDQTDTITVSGTAGNTYSAAIDTVTDATNNNRVVHWEVNDSVAGAETVTVAFANAPVGFRAIFIAEVTGVLNVANDGHNGQHQNAPGTGADAVSSGAASSTVTCFQLALSLRDSGTGVPNIGTGFSLERAVWDFGATATGNAEKQASVASGSRSGTFTASVGTDNFNTVMVLFKEALGPIIDTQPSDASAYNNDTAQFTVAATASAGSLTYQWQVSTDRCATFSNVSSGTGGTTDTYTTASLAFSDDQTFYRCAVTDSNGTTNTRAASLRILTKVPNFAWIKA